MNMKQVSFFFWSISGVWIMVGAAISVAKLLGTTVGKSIGIEYLITNNALYDFAVLYSTNTSLVHILAILFLIAWILQGITIFSMGLKYISGLFVGVNTFILLPVSIYSFWSLINPTILIIQFLFIFPLFLSWIIFPWYEFLQRKILQNLNQATKIIENINNDLDKKSKEIIHLLMESKSKTVSNTFTAEVKKFENKYTNLLKQIKETENLTKNSRKISDLEGFVYDSEKYLQIALEAENNPIFSELEEESKSAIFNLLRDEIDDAKNRIQLKCDLKDLSNLPSEYSEISSNSGKFTHIKDIFDKENVKFNNDIVDIKDYLEIVNIIFKHTENIEKFIENGNTKLTNQYNQLNEKIQEVNSSIESFSDEKIQNKYYDFRIKPIENKLNPAILAGFNKSLLFEDGYKMFAEIAHEIETAIEEIEFIHTLIIMLENNIPLSTLDITQDKEVLIHKLGINDIGGNTNNFSVSKANDNASVIEADYSGQMKDIESILHLLENEINNQNGHNKYKIKYFSNKGAEAFEKFIKFNFSDRIVCNVANEDIEVNFLEDDGAVKAIPIMFEMLEAR